MVFLKNFFEKKIMQNYPACKELNCMTVHIYLTAMMMIDVLRLFKQYLSHIETMKDIYYKTLCSEAPYSHSLISMSSMSSWGFEPRTSRPEVRSVSSKTVRKPHPNGNFTSLRFTYHSKDTFEFVPRLHRP